MPAARTPKPPPEPLQVVIPDLRRYGMDPLPSYIPEYIRLPTPPAVDSVVGLNRTALDKLTRPQQCNGYKPPVRSIIIKGGKGADRGIRLIDVKSLLAHLNGLPGDGEEGAK